MREKVTPLNGRKTHPLSMHAIMELRRIAADCPPRQTLNPGVANRLERDKLIEVWFAPTVYATRVGLIQFVRITPAGRAALASTAQSQTEGDIDHD